MLLRSSVVAFAAFAFGCSSSGGSSAPTDQGQQGPSGTSTQTVDKNPYGAEYPTVNIGIDARQGTRPGNLMRNFKFQGYKTPIGTAVNPNGKLEQVSLAEYFDPELRGAYKVLHITVSSVWCSPCNEETKEMVATANTVSGKGVLYFQALADGPSVGTGATIEDLDFWVKKHKVNFTQVLDPSLKNFGGFFDAAAVPFNANIDLRSMEILSAGTGAPQDLEADVMKWVSWVDKNPAQATK